MSDDGKTFGRICACRICTLIRIQVRFHQAKEKRLVHNCQVPGLPFRLISLDQLVDSLVECGSVLASKLISSSILKIDHHCSYAFVSGTACISLPNGTPDPLVFKQEAPSLHVTNSLPTFKICSRLCTIGTTHNGDQVQHCPQQ